jgi:hypothetical protein
MTDFDHSTISHWFLNLGPHGSQFHWGKPPRGEPRLGGIRHLEEVIDERTQQDPGFPETARNIALMALENESTNIVRRGIQVLAVVGREEDFPLIQRLLDHSEKKVAADARCFFVYKGMRSVKRKESK